EERDADEIVNDTFMSIWEKRSELSLDASLKPLLYTIVKNKSINHLKKRRPDITLVEDDPVVSSGAPDIVSVLSEKELRMAIYKLIDQLPPKCKRIFVMSRKEQ